MGATLVSFAPNVISRITSIGISLTIVVSIIVSTIVVAMIVTRTSSGGIVYIYFFLLNH